MYNFHFKLIALENVGTFRSRVCRCFVPSYVLVSSTLVPEGSRDTKAHCSYRDGIPSLLYREPVHHWEVGADCQQHSLLHFITPTLCCCSPSLAAELTLVSIRPRINSVCSPQADREADSDDY